MKNLLYIIKHDRQTAIGLLVVLIALCTIVYEFCTPQRDARQDDDAEYTKEEGRDEGKYYAVPEKAVKLQPFDPNTADSTVLLGLGLQPWQVRSIYKYRAAGGVYTCPEDFARLYGLSLKKYKELRPYIHIGADYRPAAESVSRNNRSYTPASSGGNYANATSAANDDRPAVTSNKIKPGQTMSLSASDTTALQRVPGIGPYFARKIVNYREQLGGYVSKEQLLEIQDFPESTLPYLELTSTSVRKLNINKASAEQLRKHPYITYAMAREVMNYRRMRGNISNINDLSLLPSFTKETIAKLRPYIEY